MSDTLEFLDAARSFAYLGGRLSLEWFRRERLDVERKGDESPVTVADRSVEVALRDAIARRFPSHAVVGEEYGGELGRERYEWIVDPIDGTKSFIRGVPLYTTLVALLIDGEPAVGVVYCPPTGELAAAAVGHGAWDERGRRMHVSQCTDPAEAWLLSTDPADLLRRRPQWAKTALTNAGAVRTWADAYGYLLVARGDADCIVDPIMSPWDIAPLGVIVREAGGVFTDMEGETRAVGISAAAAATPELHARLIRGFAD